MPDFKQIKVDNVIHKVKDEQARNDITKLESDVQGLEEVIDSIPNGGDLEQLTVQSNNAISRLKDLDTNKGGYTEGQDTLPNIIYHMANLESESHGYAAISYLNVPSSGALRFNCIYAKPYNAATWISFGLLATNRTSIGMCMTIELIDSLTSDDNNKYFHKTATVDSNSNNGSYNWTKGSVSVGDVWYARPFAQYTDIHGNTHTFYGQTVAGTINNKGEAESVSLEGAAGYEDHITYTSIENAIGQARSDANTALNSVTTLGNAVQEVRSEVSSVKGDISNIKETDYGAGVNLLKSVRDLELVVNKGAAYTQSEDSFIVEFMGGEDSSGVFDKYGSNFPGKEFVCTATSTSNCTLRFGNTTDGVQNVSLTAGESKQISTNLYSDKSMVFYCATVCGITFTDIMVKSTSITDSTYYPHIKTNKTLTEDVAVLPENAKKNYLDVYNLNTVSGFTFTVDSEEYVTQSPTDSDSRGWTFSNSNWILTLPAGDWVLYTYAKTVTSNTFASVHVVVEGVGPIDVGSSSQLTKTFSETKFTLESTTTVGIMAKIYDGSYRFMVCPAGTSSDYVPYMMSNLELTHDTEGVRGFGRNLIDFDTYFWKANDIDGWGEVIDDGKLKKYRGMNEAFGYVDPIVFSDTGDIDVIASAELVNEEEYTNSTRIELYDSSGNIVVSAPITKDTVITGIASSFGIRRNFGPPSLFTITKPMVRLAKYADDPTFYPYLPTIKQLHEQYDRTIVDIRKSFTCSVADTWEYTGVKFTIPSNSFFTLCIQAGYRASEPLGIALATSKTSFTGSTKTYEDISGYPIKGAFTGYSSSSKSTVLYVWGKWKDVGVNDVIISGWYELARCGNIITESEDDS